MSELSVFDSVESSVSVCLCVSLCASVEHDAVDCCRIIGLYVSLVLVVGKFLRMWTEDRAFRIMVEEMPDPDYIIDLCKDIYVSRESHEWRIEEELFAKLLYLFKSPDMLFIVSQIGYSKRKRL